MTRKDEIPLSCNRLTNLLISGYIIGSPTRDKAQCWGRKPSSNLADLTPGTPVIDEPRHEKTCILHT